MLKSMQEVLEYSFDVLNDVYYGGSLPPIVITLQSSPRTNGHFTCGKVWRIGVETRTHELNISVEHLDRPIENILASLNHELIHYFCSLNGIADTSQNGRYHNKNFKREAEARGLIISQGKYIGWSITEPSQGFIEVIRSHGIEKPMDINRDGERYIGVMGLPGGQSGVDGQNGVDGIMLPKKTKCSTRKYICPGCGNSFRATKDINVMCLDCGEQFVKVEK